MPTGVGGHQLETMLAEMIALLIAMLGAAPAPLCAAGWRSSSPTVAEVNFYRHKSWGG